MASAVYTNKPGCYATEIPQDPPAPWAFDGGKSCGQAIHPEGWEKLLSTTPGCIQDCIPCAKAVRASLIASGVIKPFIKKAVNDLASS